MHIWRKDYQAGYTNHSRNATLIEFIRGICSSKRPLPVILPASIVRAKKRARIWILDSSGKLSTRLRDTELEVLAYTCLESRSYIPISLKLSSISNGGIE